MKALVWHGARDLRIEDVPEPAAPRPGEAIVEVAYCGICGTDLHEYADGPVLIRTGPHPLTNEAPPLALGHEMSGRIAALGTEVAGLQVGDRVTVDPCWSCGTCYWCRRGEYHICRVGGAVGLASNGALAEYVRVPLAGVVALPDAVDDRHGALVEPLAVGVHAASRGGIRSGDTALISGFGPIGAAVLLAVVAAGATTVLVSEPLPGRRALALQLGATDVLDPTETDVRREAFLRTGRVGPDVVFECSGVPALLPAAVAAARRGGRVVLTGVAHGAAEVVTNDVVLYERSIVGSLGYQHDLPRVVELLRTGRIDPSPLVTGVVPLEDAVAGAFDALLTDRGNHLKILVDVGGR
jgi:(R,R)-butanediol dehydrogenase/meso-butanediol dehydrogenase/diacetyl reductase